MPEKSWTGGFYDLPPQVVMGFAEPQQITDRRGLILSPASVIPLRAPDPALEEEARTAARIVRGFRGTAEERARCESEMVERYSRGLGYLLARQIGDNERARDLLQETFCIAIEKLRENELEQPERLAGYLRGIAVRVALNAGRRRKREPVGLDSSAIAAIPNDERRQFQHVSGEETQSAVHKILQSMPVERDRELLIRFYVYDQDKQEICRELGLNSLHFNRVLFRAKNRFRKLLEKSADVADFMPSGDD
jgi:RNA polymerase sigma-70 factor (ECF subfamily)